MARDPLNRDGRRNRVKELMELWIEEVRGFDEMRASHNDLLSVQKSMEIEGWLAFLNIQDNADWMFLTEWTGECSSFGFDGGNHFRLEWGSSNNNCCGTPFFSSTNRSISVVRRNGEEAASVFLIKVISSTSDTRNSGGNSSLVTGAKLPWWR